MNLRKYKYIILLFAIYSSLTAQSIPLSSGSAAGYGVAQATAAWNDVHAASNNQAGIVDMNHWGIQLSAANLYGLGSLNVFNASVAHKIGDAQAVSLSIKHVGDSDFNNQIIGLAYARKLATNFSMSLQADLLTYQAKQYGNKYLPTVEIGTMYQATKNIRVGFHVFNPFAQKLTEDDNLSSIFRLGVLYTLSKNVSMMAEVEKDLVFDYNLKAGIEYKPIEKFIIRAGFNTAGRQFNMGLAYTFGDFTIHGSASAHQQLGTTTAAEFSYTK